MNTFRTLSGLTLWCTENKETVFLSDGFKLMCELQNRSESLKFCFDLLVLGALGRPNMQVVRESRKREDAAHWIGQGLSSQVSVWTTSCRITFRDLQPYKDYASNRVKRKITIQYKQIEDINEIFWLLVWYFSRWLIIFVKNGKLFSVFFFPLMT